MLLASSFPSQSLARHSALPMEALLPLPGEMNLLPDDLKLYRVAHERIYTKVSSKSDVLVILLPKLAVGALQRQLRVFIDRSQDYKILYILKFSK